MHKLLAESKRVLSRETDARSDLFERSQRTLREMDEYQMEKCAYDAAEALAPTYEMIESKVQEMAYNDGYDPSDEQMDEMCEMVGEMYEMKSYNEMNEMEMDYGNKKKRMKPQYEMKSKGYGRRGKYEMNDKESGKYKSEMKDKGYGSKK